MKVNIQNRHHAKVNLLFNKFLVILDFIMPCTEELSPYNARKWKLRNVGKISWCFVENLCKPGQGLRDFRQFAWRAGHSENGFFRLAPCMGDLQNLISRTGCSRMNEMDADRIQHWPAGRTRFNRQWGNGVGENAS